MTNSILQTTSFSLLNDDGKDAVSRLFNNYYKQGEMPEWNIKAIAVERRALAVSVATYGQKLSKVNPATFKYLNPQQQEVLKQELLVTFYILSAQFHLDEVEHRRQNQESQSDQIKQCAKLIHHLQTLEMENHFEAELAQEVDDSEKHCKYLGLRIVAPFITEKVTELSSGKTVVIKNWMGDINGRRLYWVWGGGFTASIIALLPDTIGNVAQARWAVGAPSIVTGNMSWALYYARFGINLGLLLKHTIAGPWMSEEEKKIPAYERFKTQWDMRKFSLLNDSIWGLANMACYFWLIGEGLAGYFGNVATAALLLMDISLNTWRFMEEITQHNVNIERFNRDMASLKEKISLTKEEPERSILTKELVELEKAKRIYEFDWKYKKQNTLYDLYYSIGLLLAFTVVIGFFCLPGTFVPATALLLGCVGAGLCFTANFIYAAAAGQLEVDKANESGDIARKECDSLITDFIARSKGLSDFEKRAIFLEMKQLIATTKHQAELASHQQLKLLRGVLVDALVPPVFLASFLFLPLGAGIAVLAAGFSLAFMTNRWLENNSPKGDSLPELNEEEYKRFIAEPKLENLLPRQDASKGNRFFSKYQSETQRLLDEMDPGVTNISLRKNEQ